MQAVLGHEAKKDPVLYTLESTTANVSHQARDFRKRLWSARRGNTRLWTRLVDIRTYRSTAYSPALGDRLLWIVVDARLELVLRTYGRTI
jgi:hypothetical protein